MRNRIVVVLLFAVVLPCLAAGAFLGYWKACATSTTRDESSIPGQVCLSASPCREDPEAQPPSSMPARRKESVSPPPMDPERWGKIQEAFHATLVSKGSPELLKLLNEGKEEPKSLPYEAPVVEIQAKPELLPSPSVVEPVSEPQVHLGAPSTDSPKDGSPSLRVNEAILPVSDRQSVAPPSGTTTDSPPQRVAVAAKSPELLPLPDGCRLYRVRQGETFRDVARSQLGQADRWREIAQLNPGWSVDYALPDGTVLSLPLAQDRPPDHRIAHPVSAISSSVPGSAPRHKTRPVPLTGTYSGTLTDDAVLFLPDGVRRQLGDTKIVYLAPGPDGCLYLASLTRLERFAAHGEGSPSQDDEARRARRLFFARTQRCPVGRDGRMEIAQNLRQSARLDREVLVIGVDDHFEIWDARRWQEYSLRQSPEPPRLGKKPVQTTGWDKP